MPSPTALSPADAPPAPADPPGLVLQADAITYAYGSTRALVGVDLSIAAGECVALLGPNGAGKTTLAQIVVGLRRPAAGRVRVVGGDPARAATRSRIGVVQQEVGFPRTLRVGEVVHGAAQRAGARPGATARVLDELGLAGLARRRAHQLSGGQQQRLQLAMALVGDPALLVLDEPSEGLDLPARRDLWRTIAARRDAGTGVLLTTHAVAEAAEVADRVVVLSDGRVLADATPSALTSRIPDRTVRLRTRVDAAEVRALHDVIDVRRDGDHLVIASVRPEPLVAELLTRDPDATDLIVTGASLADALLALSGDRLAEPTLQENPS